MKHIETIETRDLAKSAVTGGCGECQTSCQSACKTSCLLYTSVLGTPPAFILSQDQTLNENCILLVF